MSEFTPEELRQRAFKRAALVLKHYWEEQKDEFTTEARVHSRLFDPLVPDCHVFIGKSKKGGGHREHLVPCVVLRDRAFSMYRDMFNEDDVAKMLEQFLRIADITPAEAKHIDHTLKLKTSMPPDWSFETGSVMARLIAGGVELETI